MGKCTRCSNTAEAGKALCTACHEKAYQRRMQENVYRKEKGLCFRCGKVPPVMGLKVCQKCRDKRNERDRNSEKFKINNRKKSHEYRKKWIEAGLCARCGKRPPAPGKRNCDECRKEGHDNYLLQKEEKRHTAQVRREKGLCHSCGNAPSDPGFTSCKKCRDKNRQRWRSKRFTGNYLIALERDNYTCQLCGLENPRQIHIHHIDGNGTTSETQNDEIQNLITLCGLCHYGITILRRDGVILERVLDLIKAPRKTS
jgi:hypothetical protein